MYGHEVVELLRSVRLTVTLFANKIRNHISLVGYINSSSFKHDSSSLKDLRSGANHNFTSIEGNNFIIIF